MHDFAFGVMHLHYPLEACQPSTSRHISRLIVAVTLGKLFASMSLKAIRNSKFRPTLKRIRPNQQPWKTPGLHFFFRFKTLLKVLGPWEGSSKSECALHKWFLKKVFSRGVKPFKKVWKCLRGLYVLKGLLVWIVEKWVWILDLQKTINQAMWISVLIEGCTSQHWNIGSNTCALS